MQVQLCLCTLPHDECNADGAAPPALALQTLICHSKQSVTCRRFTLTLPRQPVQVRSRRITSELHDRLPLEWRPQLGGQLVGTGRDAAPLKVTSRLWFQSLVRLRYLCACNGPLQRCARWGPSAAAELGPEHLEGVEKRLPLAQAPAVLRFDPIALGKLNPTPQYSVQRHTEVRRRHHHRSSPRSASAKLARRTSSRRSSTGGTGSSCCSSHLVCPCPHPAAP